MDALSVIDACVLIFFRDDLLQVPTWSILLECKQRVPKEDVAALSTPSCKHLRLASAAAADQTVINCIVAITSLS